MGWEFELAFHNGLEDSSASVAEEGSVAIEHLVNSDAERPPIAGRGVPLAFQDLTNTTSVREVQRSANKGTSGGKYSGVPTRV